MRLSLLLPLIDQEGCSAAGKHNNLHLCLKYEEWIEAMLERLLLSYCVYSDTWEM